MGREVLLDSLFGENYDPEITMKLADEMEKSAIAGFPIASMYWTKMKGLSRSVEGKVFSCGPSTFNVPYHSPKALIIIPGYRGDFVLQEENYVVKTIAVNATKVIVLRHNALRIIGEDMQNYVHCPSRVELAKKAERYQYLGGQDFSFLEASLELLTALEALNLEKVENIHILGHSWGARIALLSLDQLIENERQQGIPATKSPILQKIRSVILLGPWLETRREKILGLEAIVAEEAQGGYFRNMRADQFITDMLDTAVCLKDTNLKGLAAPVHIICADRDEHIPDIEGEIGPVFEKLRVPRKSLHILGDLKQQMPPTIGGREVEVHDYAAPVVYDMIQEILTSAD